MKRLARRILTALFVVIVLASVGMGVGYAVWRSLFTGVADAGSTQVFEIPPGVGLSRVTQELAAGGYIRNARALEWYGRLNGLDTRLQAGRYLISDTMPAVEILQKIVTGDAVFDELVVTIPEGRSAHDIELRLEALGLFSRERFARAAVMQPRYRDFEFLEPLADDTILDGYLFPDTYRVFSDSTPESIVRRMLENFGRRVTPEMRRSIAEQGRSLHEVLTLASIVQAESNVGEMREVAGVFWKRLQEYIPLESDATVNYVLGTSKRQPTFADTEVEHPYNTYENIGLPPGPIGNPGLEAIRAAIDPAENPYYFFLHKDNGEIVLSRTFAEHLRNKARYLD